MGCHYVMVVAEGCHGATQFNHQHFPSLGLCILDFTIFGNRNRNDGKGALIKLYAAIISLKMTAISSSV